MRLAACAIVLFVAACGAPSSEHRTDRPLPERPRAQTEPEREPVVISVVGTNDLHGNVARVAVLGGYLRNLRAARERDGGGVVLLDAGDMFQGTIESNTNEGRSIIEAYDIVGYDAAAVGNHEFDYGPEGPLVVPREEGDDPRGALKARAVEASFPLLLANMVEAETGERPEWEDMPATVVLEVAGVKIGVIGLTTAETLTTTIAGNVSDLRMLPLAETAERHARALRDGGAQVILVSAHAGGKCRSFDDPDDLSSCDESQEVFELARALPRGLVDVIVAGHTHSGVAHRVNGIAVIESFALGRAFGRVDLTVTPEGEVRDARIHAPQELCATPDAELEDCRPSAYEDAEVTPDQRVLDAVSDELAEADRIRAQPSGVTLAAPLDEGPGENALGNFLADLILRTRPRADVAIMNGGGVRANIAPGELTYGALYGTFPFDNRYAFARTTVAALEALYERILTSERSFMYIAGARVRARCEGGELDVDILRPNGRPWPSHRPITVAMSDFLASGGDSVAFEGAEIEVEDGEPMREAMFATLRAQRGMIRPTDHFDPERPRVDHPGERPVRCQP